ncbi:GntR family transcriptional regulator [Streptomyces sp. NPDC059009]|uniref:GntR family transcriptional regulator n=1 Tax=Streptomyces sp. NPDC059009 TaxID=3346694 RepID=UPI00368ACA77
MAVIDRHASTHRYIELANRIRSGIVSGEFPPGRELPTYDEFRDEWGYARSVAQAALDLLKREGLIDSGRGRRSKVRERRPILTHTASFARREVGGKCLTWKRQCAELGMEGAQRTGQIREIPVPDEVAPYLDLEPGEPVVLRPRVMLADGEPVELADSYYPLDVARGTPLAEHQLVRGGPYAAMAEAGLSPETYEEEIGVRPALSGERSALNLSGEEAVISLIRTVYGRDERPLECCVMVLRADRHKLKYELPMHL